MAARILAASSEDVCGTGGYGVRSEDGEGEGEGEGMKSDSSQGGEDRRTRDLIWKLAGVFIAALVFGGIAGNTKMEVGLARVAELEAWRATQMQASNRDNQRSRENAERLARIETELRALSRTLERLERDQREQRARDRERSIRATP